MSQSNTPEPGGGERPFDAEEFARQTVRSIELGDAYAGVLEDRVARVEQCIAARWPRRWLLWARLRREIRASAATWPDDYIARKDFLGRRGEWADFTASERYGRQAWKPEFGSVGQADDTGSPEGTADPGEGFLP